MKKNAKKYRCLGSLALLGLMMLAACDGPKTAGGGDEEEGYNPQDALTFGLVGDVKEVRLSVAKRSNLLPGEDPWVEDDELLMTFDERGRVTLDPYGNVYVYDEKGRLIKGLSKKTTLTRDDEGRLGNYDNEQGLNDRDMRHFTFTHDAKGRLLTVEQIYWEAITTDSMVYEGSKIYPAKTITEGQAEAETYKVTTTYKYVKTDAHGNWTERYCYYTAKGMIADDETTRSTDKGESLERRKIIYYSDDPEEAEADEEEVPADVAGTTATDVRAFGFLGPVKESFCNMYEADDIDADELEKGDPVNSNDSEQGYSFNADGQILTEPYGGVYEYDNRGRFVKGITEKSVMRRDAKGRVVYYLQQNDEDDDARFENKFTYDEQDRLIKIERTFWESFSVEEFSYEGDNIYPSSREYSSEEEGTSIESRTEYRYTKFDDKGNWTRREQRYRGSTAEGGELSRTSWRGAMVVEREIEYY